MPYIGSESDPQRRVNKRGVLLVNLGTPDRPVCPSLRRYLAEFLMDPRVIELPHLLRTILVRGIIVNVRSHKSAAAYREVWTDAGSPLLINTNNVAEKTQTILGDGFHVEVAMRYGNPSIQAGLDALFKAGIRDVTVIPMYPQYSGSTNGSTFDALTDALKKHRWIPKLNFISEYYQHPQYINAICESIKAHWQEHGRADRLMMSFHGVPKKYITKGDPYYAQCQATALAVAERLGLGPEDWMLVFQSRLGAEEWLKPYCDETLKTLPSQGIKAVDVICPGFSVDCLETIEEIDGENREYFIDAGGERYSYIKCLNDSDAHAELFADLCKHN
ncbi:MAG: ferrochelatase [Arenicella sp.]|jgi:ferrochelatase|nr:ferrochelatase [Arenicella sp.]